MTVTVLDRALVAGDAGGVTGERRERPDPEVPERARRRTFTAQYKLDVVAEYDAAATGEKGAILRREGLYSSHVVEWRRARDAGSLAGPARRRDRQAADPRDAQIARLLKEKAKLEQELAKARFVVDVQSTAGALGDDLRERGHRARVEFVTDEAIALMAPGIGTRAACAAAGVPQATWYRRHRISPPRPKAAPVPDAERVQPRALAPAGRQVILDVLHTGRFADLARAKSGRRCRTRAPTWGRCLPSTGCCARPARAGSGARRPPTPPPSSPNWQRTGRTRSRSWDITKLHGPAKWTYYYLYVILDIYSRYVVGWMVATCESAVLAEKLIAATCAKQGISRGQLSIHADRGSSMTSKPVALLLADLGVTQSHSRPHVSNDNPYSEAQFKTLKYRPGFPARFPSDRSRPGALPGILPLVQQRASPRRARPAHRRRRPLRPGRSRPGRARPDPDRRLPRPP